MWTSLLLAAIGILWQIGGDGYCPLVPGRGWDGALSAPVPAVDVYDGRWFARGGHSGIDFNAPEGTPVTASAPGVVVWAGERNGASARTVILAHGWGWLTVYGHVSAVNVSCGQVVQRGDVIALSGSYGASWAHLHFALWRDGVAVDPAPLVGLSPPVREAGPAIRGGGREIGGAR